MKALFNSICAICRRFRPRCADMTERKGRILRLIPVCEDCRKATENKGKFTLAEKHR